jgi:hypothetical protein
MQSSKTTERSETVGLVTETAASAVTAAGMALASGSTPTQAAISAAAAAGPGLIGALGTWVHGWRGERSKKFLAWALQPSTASKIPEEELAAYLEAHAKEPWVLTTLWESLRALDDIIDEVAIPPLGRLAREYLVSKRQPDRFFRGFRRFIADSVTEDLAAFREILSFIIEYSPEKDNLDLFKLSCSPSSRLALYVEPVKQDEVSADYATLLRVFNALRANGLAFDSPNHQPGGLIPTGPNMMQLSRTLSVRMNAYFL